MKKLILLLFVTIITSCGEDDNDSIVSSSLAEEDISLALKVHNDARAAVGVQSLVWSKTLEADALEWAKTMAKKDDLSHSSKESRTGQGENLYMYWGFSSDTPAGDGSTDWYNEIDDYTYSVIGSPENANVVVLHYTQMIWSSTTEVGIGKATSASGREFVVARYSPRGNYIGAYPYEN